MGYGADAVCPYLAYESIAAMQRDGKLPASMALDDLMSKYVKGLGVGLLKVRHTAIRYHSHACASWMCHMRSPLLCS